MMKQSIDKKIEQERYNERAKKLLGSRIDKSLTGSNSVAISHRSPYLRYEKLILENIKDANSCVLELGAGTGAFTECLLNTGAKVLATDISEASLEILQKRFAKYKNISVKAADLEFLPFDDNTFDFVTSAGSLSYGDNMLVLNEIYRVLKPNGMYIAVDSLNHNPVYMLNRWIHYLRGRRTLSTLKRMPTTNLIDIYRKQFGQSSVYYFGSITWIVPFFKIFLSEKKISMTIDYFDKIVNVKKSAFKFVMCVKKVN